MKRKKQKTRSDWQQISQNIQVVYEQEKVAAGRRQLVLLVLTIVLLSMAGLGIVLLTVVPWSQPSALRVAESGQQEFGNEEDDQEEAELEEEDLDEDETSSSSVDTVGPALRQAYRASRSDYAFTWNVTSFEALIDRYSLAWDDKRQPISLDEVVAQQGKPSLLEHEDGWVYVTYSERFVDYLYEMGQYDERVTLAFKEEDGVWVLQYKLMSYMATEDLKTLVEGTPFKSRMIEGTNQKAYLRDLVSPLAVGQSSDGKGGSSLEEALDLLGLPTAYGFWNDSKTFVLVYADVDEVYLWFKRQDDGDYLLAKWD